MSTLFVMPLHVLSNRLMVLTFRHHRTPLHGVLQLEEIIFPLQSRLISREVHISAESRERRRLNDQAAPLPNGKLGTTSEGFPQNNKLVSVRHKCELQGVMTSRAVYGLRCADVHECTCINHEMTRKTAGRTTEGTN